MKREKGYEGEEGFRVGGETVIRRPVQRFLTEQVPCGGACYPASGDDAAAGS